MAHTVNIRKNGNQITIAPARVTVPFLEHAPEQEITWKAFNGIRITDIKLIDNDGSISTPEKVSDTEWRATDKNTNQGPGPKTYEYAISIDPEIENEAKPPGEDEDEG